MYSRKKKKDVYKKPSEDSGLPWFLWSILDMEHAKLEDMDIAADRLGLDNQAFGRILQGSRFVSKKFVDSQNWRKTFNRHYAKWKKPYPGSELSYAEFFETIYDELPRTGGVAPNYRRSITEKGSPGEILLKVLGGRDFNREDAKRRLKTSVKDIYKILFEEGPSHSCETDRLIAQLDHHQKFYPLWMKEYEPGRTYRAEFVRRTNAFLAGKTLTEAEMVSESLDTVKMEVCENTANAERNPEFDRVLPKGAQLNSM